MRRVLQKLATLGMRADKFQLIVGGVYKTRARGRLVEVTNITRDGFDCEQQYVTYHLLTSTDLPAGTTFTLRECDFRSRFHVHQ